MSKKYTSQEVREAIKGKFRTLTRFSVIGKIPYHILNDALDREDEVYLRRFMKVVETKGDEFLENELTDKDVSNIKKKLRGKNLKIWCFENRISHYWLQNILFAGVVKFKSKRVTIVLELLGL